MKTLFCVMMMLVCSAGLANTGGGENDAISTYGMRVFVDSGVEQSTQVAAVSPCLEAVGLKATPGVGAGFEVVSGLWQCLSTGLSYKSKIACELNCK